MLDILEIFQQNFYDFIKFIYIAAMLSSCATYPQMRVGPVSTICNWPI